MQSMHWKYSSLKTTWLLQDTVRGDLCPSLVWNSRIPTQGVLWCQLQCQVDNLPVEGWNMKYVTFQNPPILKYD